MEGKKEELDVSGAKAQAPSIASASSALPEFDDFGLPIRRFLAPPAEARKDDKADGDDTPKSDSDDKAKEPKKPVESDSPAATDIKRLEKAVPESEAKETAPSDSPEDPSTPKPNSAGKAVSNSTKGTASPDGGRTTTSNPAPG